MQGPEEQATRAAAEQVVALHRGRVRLGESPEAALRFVLRRVEAWLAGEGAAGVDWARVHPAILGSIYESCLRAPERHAQGVHFTGEEDVASVVGPTIEAPWRRRVANARTEEELRALHAALLRYVVLDPACGSGNFLVGAFRALLRIEEELRGRLGEGAARIQLNQCRGIDRDPLAVLLARATLRMAGPGRGEADVAEGDALFMPWGRVDAIVGNPPFVAKNKLAPALGRAYVDRLRAAYPEVSGRADYCVYFFRKAHDALPVGGRAGLIGTNTIGQNDSRAGGLDHVVANGGQIVDAVTSRVWPGEAVVHVSVVNWIKGATDEPRVLARQLGDDACGPWERREVAWIGASLAERDLSRAAALACNARPKRCFQGQTHGCKQFLLTEAEARALGRDVGARRWLVPYMIGEDLLGAGRPTRVAVDVSEVADIEALRGHAGLMRRLAAVRPEVQRRAAEHPHDRARQEQLRRWWRFWRPRPDLVAQLRGVSRYIVCVRVTRRPIFAFVDARVRPNDALQAFLFEDDYAFGVLQSQLHWQWFVARCSTLKGDPRYTSETVWSSFPWPQAPDLAAVRAVAEAARALRAERGRCVAAAGSLRAVYRGLARPRDEHARLDRARRAYGMAEEADEFAGLRDAHARLDRAVRGAYGMAEEADGLTGLLDVNAAVAADERAGRAVQGPGLPEALRGEPGLRSEDRVPYSAPWGGAAAATNVLSVETA